MTHLLQRRERSDVVADGGLGPLTGKRRRRRPAAPTGGA